jgi:hypothetical protein
MNSFENIQPTGNTGTTTNSFNPQKKLPNSVAVLVLGIISIPTCFCYGIVGLACGIIAIVLANKDLSLYESNPQDYELASFNNLKAGRICAIIGTSFSALYLLYVIIVLAFLGTALTLLPFGS